MTLNSPKPLEIQEFKQNPPDDWLCYGNAKNNATYVGACLPGNRNLGFWNPQGVFVHSRATS